MRDFDIGYAAGATLGLAVGAIAAAILGASACHAHDWYADQRSEVDGPRHGYSCCSGNSTSGDCEKVRAHQDADGHWIMVWRGQEYSVPDDAIKPDETNGEPLSYHGCVFQGQVL